MRKFLNKAKAAFDDHVGDSPATNGNGVQQPIQSMSDRPSQIQPPTSADVDRYRYHHGTNLGSIFILERWLTGCMFPDGSDGSSELAAVQAWISKEGADKTRLRFEKHWREYMGDQDLDWLRDVARATTVRLPIGYFTLGPAYCEGTAFKKVGSVYENGWAAVKNLVQRCNQRGIGVLIDLHGLPGGANAQEHSGTNSGKAEFWMSRSNKDLATRCLCFIAQQARSMPGVAGIQIINEAPHNPVGMYEWYDSVLRELGSIDPTMPVYVSDAWDLHTAAAWSQKHNKTSSAYSPIVVDTHLYWAFSDADKEKTPQEIAAEAQNKLCSLDNKEGSVVDRGAVQAVIGEYSCVLTEDSWAKRGDTPKEQLVREFGGAQSERYQTRAGGSFFWTYRMDWMPGGEWGFRQMTEQHAITPPQSLQLPSPAVQDRVSNAQAQRGERKSNTCSSHIKYWDSNHPGDYEHWRFEQGWDVGFSDALAFFEARGKRGFEGADKIGMVDLWILKRLRESGQGGKFVWEFEQGVRQGIRDFYQCAGV